MDNPRASYAGTRKITNGRWVVLCISSFSYSSYFTCSFLSFFTLLLHVFFSQFLHASPREEGGEQSDQVPLSSNRKVTITAVEVWTTRRKGNHLGLKKPINLNSIAFSTLFPPNNICALTISVRYLYFNQSIRL